MPYLLLTLSIALSSCRNLLSKNLSSALFGTRRFFIRQSILFAGGAVAVLLFGIGSLCLPSPLTLLYGAIYAALLIFAQWFYTVALGKGNTATCSTVYSMGFILPTLSGAILWSEHLSVLNAAGIACAAAAIVCSADFKKSNDSKHSHGYLPLLVAMLASGGLGIMQKVQQKSEVAGERGAFLTTAFILAAALSLACALFVKPDDSGAKRGEIGVAAGVGLAFGCCNLLNTALAGMLPSAVFFPTLNIGTILLTTVCGIAIYRERLTKKTLLILLLGAASILMLAFK